ncbi:MAG TPA: uroporphyrinogen-III synthase [Candidatus Tidjanibacter gallistercoris]|nr:uroporphyrinogen-III synthase [Candidatus Tidjanibacter gallistercoris]
MKIKNILISQPAPAVIEKSPFYEIIQKYGAAIDYRPFIKVVGVSLKEFRSQRVEILDHSAVVFTNRTTVDSFFRICEEARVTVPETMKYFCNTEAIALYLQKYIVYRKRKIFFADGKFDSFMELILKHKDEKFLVSLTEPNNGEIPETMEKLKLRFSKVVLAKTVAADLEGIDPGKYDLMVFYSPSEISTLVSVFGADGIPAVATFGTSTACAAANAGLRIGTLAPSPEAPSMAKAVDIYIGKINSGQEVASVVVSGAGKAAEFLKAQEVKPRRARPRKPDQPASADKKTKQA